MASKKPAPAPSDPPVDTPAPTGPGASGEHAGDGPGGRRVDPPGQTGNDHTQRPDIPPGQVGHTFEGTDGGETLQGSHKDDVVSGGGGDDTLTGSRGDDTLDGGDGADRLNGGDGADVLTGGAGGDTFGVDKLAKTAAGLDRITDFTHGEDHIDLHGLSLDEGELGKLEAPDYASALAAANAQLADGQVDAVAVQVGGDVIVFGDTSHANHADAAVILVGRTLADIGYHDFG